MSVADATPPPPPRPAVAPILERNIAALLEHRRETERSKPTQHRIADAISRFVGSMRFVGLHVVLFGGWILLNLPWVPWRKFDPSFVTLAMVASVEAIFLSTFVLITQNRLAAQADKRAELDLQMNLLAEHEITRLVTLVAAIGEKLGVEEAKDPSLAALKKEVAPEQVLERLDRAE